MGTLVIGSAAYIPKHEFNSLADMASEKYAATRCADVPNGVESSDTSNSILFASSRLSADTASAHCNSKVKMCNPSSSLFCCRSSSFFSRYVLIGGGGAGVEVFVLALLSATDLGDRELEDCCCFCCCSKSTAAACC